MALSITIDILLLSSLPFIILFYYLLRKPKSNLPPGPRQLPVIGNLHQIGILPHRTFHRLSKLHGPLLYLRLGRTPALVINSPAFAEQVLKTNDLAFCSRPHPAALELYTYHYSDVAFSPHGDHWRNLRKIFTLEFGPKKLPSFRWVREEETFEMIRSISARPDPSSALDIAELMFHLSNTVINRVAFGRGLIPGIHRMLDELQAVLGSFWAEDYFPGFGWLDTMRGLRRRMERNAMEFDKFYQEVIDEHLQYSQKKKEDDAKEDIVDVLLKLRKEGKEELTMDQIKAAILNILAGGTDTSGSTLTWAMAELTRNPTVMKKAQDEVRGVIGSKGKVEETDLSRLPYLKSVVSETLRLHPPFPLLFPRETIQETKIDRYIVPPKTTVFVNAWTIGRDEEYWEKAEEYNPDRFMGSSIDYQGNHFQFLPFGAGRRMCPGMHFGLASVQLPLANLLYSFIWELTLGMTEEEIDMMEAPGLATHKRTALYLVAKKHV